jgi:hypothetical protein
MAKKRKLKQTHLIVGEGPAELTMLRAIQCVYECKPDHKLKFESANGGSPVDIVKYARNVMDYHKYDLCTVLIDSDIPFCKKTYTIISEQQLNIIKSEPVCLEGFLLQIMNIKVIAGWDANKCKSLIEKKYKAPYKYRDTKYYEPIFQTLKEDGQMNNILKRVLNEIFEQKIA